MPSDRTLGEAERDRIPASASVQGLSVCMNGKALVMSTTPVRVVTTGNECASNMFDVTFDVDLV